MRIGFGTWPLGGVAYGHVPEPQGRDAVVEALRLGVRLYDTANIYGDGRAERLLGDVLGDVPDVRLVTKGGYLGEAGSAQDFSDTALRRSLRGSLDRLGRERVDFFLLHSPPSILLRAGEVFASMDRLREEGLIGRAGLSLRSLEDFELLEGWPDCGVVELILNLLDQRAIDRDVLGRARARGMMVIARVPLCFGFLAGGYRPGARFAAADHRSRWPASQVDAWIEGAERFRFLERPGRSLAQAALGFCLATPGLAYAIPGMKAVHQVREGVAAHSAGRLSPEEFMAAREVWQELTHLPPGGR